MLDARSGFSFSSDEVGENLSPEAKYTVDITKSIKPALQWKQQFFVS